MNDEESTAAAAVYAAATEGDWAEFRLMLHPYLHWTIADGTTIRGRVKVLDMLAARAEPLEPPRSVELRDGQIYRWRA